MMNNRFFSTKELKIVHENVLLELIIKKLIELSNKEAVAAQLILKLVLGFGHMISI